ncbi:MAG TPA: hypothetical protein VI932_11750 [Bacteroidota bacterium]|nr:hypothetical protein [Bacteroidota bacterium]
MKNVFTSSAAFTLALALNGCFPGGGTYAPFEPAGFFSGIWHGWIAPLSLIISIFSDGVRLYEPFNTGWWYDFGFYMAVISGFGGLALSRKKKNRDGH